MLLKFVEMGARPRRLPSPLRAHSSMAARHFFAASGSRLSLTCNGDRRKPPVNTISLELLHVPPFENH
ncbi:hypothetical protein EYF80_049297 [Liparis tanakae]|uniref:Uncharacterized protein n=1 Tax=Liparis tanakae TaxID=230148 RepID=A0A4Z2FHX1_9TELE|nr:hypothetical protein EYF80_049297 [Liparis tanakae]